VFNSPGVWDEPHSGRPTEPRLFKIAHFASDLVELMTATAISALRSSSSRDGIGRPTALGALAARGVVEHELDVAVLSDGGSLRRYLWARSPPREPVRERDSVAFSPYAALAMAAIIGRKARTWSKCLVRTVFSALIEAERLPRLNPRDHYHPT
jgi:hypothetical protein